MATVPLTKEHLSRFGAGDQFQLFNAEDGARIIAKITEIRLKPRSEHNDHELQIDFEDAFWLNPEENLAHPRPDISWYHDALMMYLSVGEAGDGSMVIHYTPGDQIVILVKPYHRAFRRPPQARRVG